MSGPIQHLRYRPGPSPGYDCLYPDNEVGEFYVEFMGRPGRMCTWIPTTCVVDRKIQLEWTLPQAHCPLTTAPKFAVRPYLDDSEQMHPTDLDENQGTKRKGFVPHAKKCEPPVPIGVTSLRTRRLTTTPSTRCHNRRRTAEPQSEPAELRVNDMWVETALDGSSKRIKVAQDSKVFNTASTHTDRTDENLAHV